MLAPWLVQPPTLGASALLHLQACHTLHTHHTVKILNEPKEMQGTRQLANCSQQYILLHNIAQELV